MSEARQVRCAIYTRKSSDEGLDQAFNSLHAQREACEAYVCSQTLEGWMALADGYDDGGHSGATMRRPALERLITDIGKGRVDLVIVYKVDRLTRSLADFAKLIELFDQHQVSFVSVTQAFNTTNSMSRLTLNVLLSFAQFEREITSERIRDKVAASKAKGMWMGGAVPLGYDPPRDSTRRLRVNPGEAETVRLIFQRYLEARSYTDLAKSLDRDGIRSKRYTAPSGVTRGGCRFTHGALRHLLANRVYLGEIVHKGAIYPGLHEPIVDRALFDAVAEAAGSRGHTHGSRVTRAHQTLLNGMLFDMDGQHMQPAFGQSRRGRRFEYYASPRPPGEKRAMSDAIRRVPCHVVDEVVRRRVGQLLWGSSGSIWPDELRAVVTRVEIHPQAVHVVVHPDAWQEGRTLGHAVRVIQLGLADGEQILRDALEPGMLRIVLPLRLVVWGGRQWIVGPDGLPAKAPSIPNLRLVRRLRAGHRILRECGIWPIDRTLQRYWKSPGSEHRMALAKLALLSPELQRAILSGKLQDLGARRVPLSWSHQREKFLGPPQLAEVTT